MGHSVAQIAAFTNGERALVYASRRDDPHGPLTFLRDGDAETMRDYAKSHLQCFVPGCPTPDFTTVARRGARDGFRHLTGGHHEPESLFHRQGKQAVLDWLATQPGVRAGSEAALPGRSRVADVLADGPFGRIALEVQYASLAADNFNSSWQARTDDYTAAGIRAVWLFGHYGDQMNVAADGTTIHLNAVQQHAVAAGHRLWWLNPTTGALATAYVEATVDGHTFRVPPHEGDRTARLAITPLDRARLDHDGVHTDASDDLDRHAEAYHRALDAQRARLEAQERARLQHEHRVREQAEARRRVEAEKAQREALRLQQRLAQQERDWFASPMYAHVLAAHGGTIPIHLNQPVASEAIQAHRQHWQSLLFGHLLRDQVGATISVRACLDVLRSNNIRLEPEADRVVAGWIDVLSARHFVRRGFRSDRWVVTDPKAEAQRRAQAARAREQDAHDRQRQARAQREAQIAQLAEENARRRAQRPSAGRAHVRQRVAGHDEPPAPQAPCRWCGLPLAAELTSAGWDAHIGCHAIQNGVPTATATARPRAARTCKGCAYPLTSGTTGRYHPDCEPMVVAAARHRAAQ